MDFAELAKVGAEPTPSVLQPVIVSLLERSGSGLTRHELVDAIDREWINAGGKVTEGKTVPRVKKALSGLMEQGIIQNPVLGFYCLIDTDASESGLGKLNLPAAVEGSADEEDSAEADEVVIPVDQYVGVGKQFVYAFYLPTFRMAAESKGETRWPVKIGMTTTSVQQRVASHQTALPEIPEMAILIRSDNAALLERVIHGILTMRGRRMDESAGSEWFSTNEIELIDIYKWLSRNA